jgi:hypothetical protein
MPISKGDYFKPWTPVGGNSLRDSFPSGTPPSGTGSAIDRDLLQALQAAWKTSMLCRTMLQVTKDGNYQEYPTGRHLDFAYETVLQGMQAPAVPELSPEVKARIDAAQKVLYVLDREGNIIGKTKVYQNYINNVRALAAAKANLASAFALAQRDSAKLEVFPITSGPLNDAINEARDALISGGGPRVERALDDLGSVGQPMQAHMIKKARDNFDNWNLGLSGAVPGKMPYSLILPTNWCDADDHDGFETLTVDQAEVQHFSANSVLSSSAQSWQQHAEHNSGGGVVSVGFCAFGGTHASMSSSSSFQDSSSSSFQNIFSNSAKGLHIELEFGLCTIDRPWLVSDLFFLKNWFCAGVKRNSISDGTIDGQVDSMEKTLPMIPQQFLVVRNVSISATDWGSDGEILTQFYGTDQGSETTGASSTSGAAGVCLGFLNFGGRAGHSEASSGGQSSSFSASSGSDHFGSTFENSTLRIPGAQIVAFLCDIVPACPELNDPSLPG